MNTVIIVCICGAVALAAPPSSEEQLAIAARRALPAILHEEAHDKLGQYSLRYVTAEGTIVVESGELVPTADGKGVVMVTKGEVTYIGDDGKQYVTKYSAGLDGFKVEGDHLPTGPIVPAPSA